MKRVVGVLVATLLVGGLAACADDANDSSTTVPPSASTTGEATAVTTTTVLATPATSEGAVDSASIPIIDVSFAENECVVDLPLDIPAGTAAFALTQVDGVPGAEVRVGPLLEDSTFDDFLDQQQEAGGNGAYWEKPDWLGLSALSFEAIDVELAANQEVFAYTVSEGSHALWIVHTSPPGLWPCGPLYVRQDM